MNKKELKEWLEKNVDGIEISDDGMIRTKDGWKVYLIDKPMAMDIEELDAYADVVKDNLDLWNKVYEILIRTLEYKLKKEVME